MIRPCFSTSFPPYVRSSQTVAPQLPEYLQECFLKALEKECLRSMPNSYLPAAPVPRKGALLLGDALNMRCVVVKWMIFSASDRRGKFGTKYSFARTSVLLALSLFFHMTRKLHVLPPQRAMASAALWLCYGYG